MTRRRFYAPPSAFTPELINLAADEAWHLRDVLRLKPGDEVYVFDGVGKEFRCQVEESRRDAAQLRIVDEVEPARPESPLQLTLAVALLKGEKFDLVVQKATELGVTLIVPIVTRHADIRLRDESDAAKRVVRWQRIALEAAKQSGRAVVPEVSNVVSFDSLIQPAPRDIGGVCLMFSERNGQTLTEARRDFPVNFSSFTAIIGSEGGWADEEIADAEDAGWTIVTLGGRILRAETAAIAVAVLIQHLVGDLV